jgi:RecQ family ATP-dependent DNA helicase
MLPDAAIVIEKIEDFCLVMNDPRSILEQYWKYPAFRPLQEEIIQTVLDGKDCLAVLPTGGGKSICFQVPALAKEGICLVVSPLIALMKDQVENLKKRGIPALLIHSGMQRRDVVQTLKNATQDYFRFLYVSPERLETSLFKEYLPALNVNLIAVDEAHCISQWGYDFRPSYLRIAGLRKELPGIPVLALTASATPEVQEDICKRLEFGKMKYSVSPLKEKTSLTVYSKWIPNWQGSGDRFKSSRQRNRLLPQQKTHAGDPRPVATAGHLQLQLPCGAKIRRKKPAAERLD